MEHRAEFEEFLNKKLIENGFSLDQIKDILSIESNDLEYVHHTTQMRYECFIAGYDEGHKKGYATGFYHLSE